MLWLAIVARAQLVKEVTRGGTAAFHLHLQTSERTVTVSGSEHSKGRIPAFASPYAQLSAHWDIVPSCLPLRVPE
jgi:hypothetical protein